MATVFAVLIAIPLGTMAALIQRHLDRLYGPHLHDRRPVDPVVLVWHADHPGPARPRSIGCRRSPSCRFRTIPLANLSQLIWPALAVGYRYCAVVARMIRSSLLEVLQEDYIRTARAKGVFESW